MTGTIKDIPFTTLRERAIIYTKKHHKLPLTLNMILNLPLTAAFHWGQTTEGGTFWFIIANFISSDSRVLKRYELKSLFTNKQSTNASTSKQP